jgi:MinD superfamily P-loop ATPase
MKQLVIISGKGGTGKTILSASFAHLAENHVMADCDVDAANLELLLQTKILETHPFSGSKTAVLDAGKCTGCGQCFEVCRFNAVTEKDGGEYSIDPVACEGCAVCAHMCPEKAIDMIPAKSGEWYISETAYGPMVHAKLGIGEESSGKLVTEVRRNAKEIAEKQNRELVIIDGPPGIGCPVIAALSGTDFAVVVTEPTFSGIQDMERVIQTAAHFQTAVACIVNKYDINQEQTRVIENWCRERQVPILGKIPFDTKVIDAMVKGVPPVAENHDGAGAEAIRRTWDMTKSLLRKEPA